MRFRMNERERVRMYRDLGSLFEIHESYPLPYAPIGVTLSLVRVSGDLYVTTTGRGLDQ